MNRGYIYHAFFSSGAPDRYYLVGRHEDGSTFACVDDSYVPSFWIRASDAPAAAGMVSGCRFAHDSTPARTMDGGNCVRVEGPRQALEQTAATLIRNGVRTYEADLHPADSYLLYLGTSGPIEIDGDRDQGSEVHWVYKNPTIRPGSLDPQPRILSFDIETSLDDGSVTAVSLVTSGPGPPVEPAVLLVPPSGSGQSSGHGLGPPVRLCRDEVDLLGLFAERIRHIDPDIITGWNIVEFDLRVLFDRFRRHGIKPRLGRSRLESVFLPRDSSGAAGVVIHGRQVVDAMRLVRHGPQRFASNALDYVAREVLGEGKLIVEEDKAAALRRTYNEDPKAFAQYCLTDAELVLRILEKTGLLRLTLTRARLVGVRLNQAWTSIQAFERLYTARLHTLGFVAPSAGVDSLPSGEAPGGAILTPLPGLHNGVQIYDFKSLYPSIMMTFNVDPLAYAQANNPESRADSLIRAPNNALFARSPAVLPDMLRDFFAGRAEAKAGHDDIASYVYKIVMNSFYGVLGTPGCRFAGVLLAGAVTEFGRMILKWTRDEMIRRGYTVIYGDTDSLFLIPESPAQADHRDHEGTAEQVTQTLAAWVKESYGVESHLELEYEKTYERFFLPTIRHVAAGEPARGRAKGYAGRRSDTGELEVRGMEAARRDWSELARSTQLLLLNMVFDGRGPKELGDAVRNVATRLRDGHEDAKLVYEKALRKRVEDYTATAPPHVKAAMLLPPAARRGIIRYVMTMDGPQPAHRRASPFDYEHYVEKQLRPVVETLATVTDHDLPAALDLEYQPRLF